MLEGRRLLLGFRFATGGKYGHEGNEDYDKNPVRLEATVPV
jgi:hypothetical protein